MELVQALLPARKLMHSSARGKGAGAGSAAGAGSSAGGSRAPNAHVEKLVAYVFCLKLMRFLPVNSS